jgi:hypothetical protein
MNGGQRYQARLRWAGMDRLGGVVCLDENGAVAAGFAIRSDRGRPRDGLRSITNSARKLGYRSRRSDGLFSGAPAYATP